MNRQKTSYFQLFAIACITGLIFLGIGSNNTYSFLNAVYTQPSFAQTPRPQDVWQQVYQKLPNLPLENKYISKETNKVDENSTLVTRLLQYHIYVKGRAPAYRLDWKLTLADYLGVNELISEAAYPGNATLKTNPIERDRAAINRLTRKERNDLVQTLVSLFNQNTQSSSTNSSSPTANPNPPSPPTAPLPPRPGDAQRLKL